MKLKILDLFCGAGGCSAGYVKAGFEVVGVDHKYQRCYPYEFVCSDWESYLRGNYQHFDLVHASPPCQGYSVSKTIQGNDHPMLIETVRNLLIELRKPYIIENVIGAPLINPIRLRGNMFGLKVKRDRLFESNLPLIAPALTPMGGRSGHEWGTTRKQSMRKNPSLFRGECDFVCVSGHSFLVNEARYAMGIDWMSRDELSQAIPPAYTEYIGEQLIDILSKRAV